MFLLKELDEVNLKIANAVARGQLDASPFLQGILLHMLRKLDKEKRGVALCGRPLQVCNAMEEQLLGRTRS